MTPTNEYFDHLRADEEQQQREQKINSAYAGGDEVPAEGYENGERPGHLGNDTSKMTLLETDLQKIAQEDDPEPNPQVRDALRKLNETDFEDEKGRPLITDEERTLEDRGVKDRDNLPDSKKFGHHDADGSAEAPAGGEIRNVEEVRSADEAAGGASGEGTRGGLVARPEIVTDADVTPER